MAATKAQEAKRKEDLRGNVILFWKLVGMGIGLVLLIFLLISWGVFGALPDHTKLENPDTDLATEIVTSDGETLGKFYKDNRNQEALAQSARSGAIRKRLLQGMHKTLSQLDQTRQVELIPTNHKRTSAASLKEIIPTIKRNK